jgi:hypothetical protein
MRANSSALTLTLRFAAVKGYLRIMNEKITKLMIIELKSKEKFMKWNGEKIDEMMKLINIVINILN